MICTNFSRRNLICGALQIAVLLLLATFEGQPASAEGRQNMGTDAEGVNRRVTSNSSGFVEVEGTVNISFDLPLLTAYDNSPSAYLGGNINGTEFDAGLQYETRPIGEGEDAVAPGWVAFMRGGDSGTAGYTSPRVWGVLPGAPEGTLADSVPWRNYGESIESLLRLEFTSAGEVSIYVGAMGGKFFHYPRVAYAPISGLDPRQATASDPIAPYRGRLVPYFTTADRTTANVKRVVAMTRDNNEKAELDGTTMTVLFKGGRVRLYSETTGNSWVSDDVNQGTDATGYDAPANGAANRAAWDKTFQRGNRWFLTPAPDESRTIVEFPNLNVGNIEGRTNSPQSHSATENDNSRYTRETVNINLRHTTGISGTAIGSNP